MFKVLPLRRISSAVFRRPSRILDEVNSNALMREWTNKNPAPRQFDDRYDMFEYLNTEILKLAPVDYLEFGVFKGASIRRWAEINQDAASRFHGFDTFEGLPEGWDRLGAALEHGHFDTEGQLPETRDSRIRYHKGLFQQTLQPFLKDFKPANRVVIHNDSDLYNSSLFCLTQLDTFLVPGSILIFDEFYSSSHEFQAFYDYTESYMRKYKVLSAVGKDPYQKIAICME